MGADGDGAEGEVLQADGGRGKQLQAAEEGFEQLVKGVRAMLRYA